VSWANAVRRSSRSWAVIAADVADADVVVVGATAGGGAVLGTGVLAGCAQAEGIESTSAVPAAAEIRINA
jgi:hypothetical protein